MPLPASSAATSSLRREAMTYKTARPHKTVTRFHLTTNRKKRKNQQSFRIERTLLTNLRFSLSLAVIVVVT